MKSKNRVWTVESDLSRRRKVSSASSSKNVPKWKGTKTWKKLVKDWLVDTFKSYCSTTGMHGFSHIIREDSTPGERRAWMFIVATAIIVSVVLLWVSWHWNEETPTVTVIESTQFPTWNIAFPAITICNFNKISKTKAEKLAGRLKRPDNMTEEDLKNLFHVVMYYSGGLRTNISQYAQLHAILQDNDYTAQKLLNALLPTCNELLFRCMWKGTQTRCDSLFQVVNTTEGVCCSFNYYGLALTNYPTKLAYTIPNVPRRVTGCGYQTGLTVLLKPNTKDYYGTYLSSYGFRILVHDSHDFPDENGETKVLTSRRESFLSISPESTYGTDNTRGLDIETRKCLFFDERKLEVMQKYSYINCLAECRTKLVYEKCGCVPGNLPSNGSLPLCDVHQIPCVVSNWEIIVGSLPGLNQSIVRQQRPDKMPCDCLPDCEVNHYPAEITSGVLNRDFSYSHITLFKGVKIVDEVLLHVYFNDLVSTRYRKDIYQNWLGTLASFGGLVGLIIGFSIVTAFEFIYYLTLRPLFDQCSKH